MADASSLYQYALSEAHRYGYTQVTPMNDFNPPRVYAYRPDVGRWTYWTYNNQGTYFTSVAEHDFDPTTPSEIVYNGGETRNAWENFVLGTKVIVGATPEGMTTNWEATHVYQAKEAVVNLPENVAKKLGEAAGEGASSLLKPLAPYMIGVGVLMLLFLLIALFGLGGKNTKVSVR